VQPGDIVTLPRGREVIAVRIEAVALRRGPSVEARRLYSVVEESLLDPAAPPS
jgi:ribosomal 50S subunit-recycling heat shock protein